MKVLFFIPTLKGGGAERVALNLVKEAHKNNVEVILAVSKAEGVLYREFEKYSKIIDLNSKRVLFSLPKLIKAIKYEKPGAIVSFMDHCNVIHLLAKLTIRSHSFKSIITIHNNLQLNLFKTSKVTKFFLVSCIKSLYPLANKIVSVSEGVKNSLGDYLTADLVNKVQVIYNPCLDESILEKADEIADFPFDTTNAQIICGVGRLTRQKGFDILIRAFSSVVNNTRYLIILGVGEEEEKLKNLISELKLEKSVFLMGFQENPYKYIKNADVFAFSSRWEGFGVAVVEAMYLRKKIVSTDCDYGPREILDNGRFGHLVNVEDVEELGKALDKELSEDNYEIELTYLNKFKSSEIFSQYQKIWS